MHHDETEVILFEAQDELFTKEAEKTSSTKLICAVGASDLTMTEWYVRRDLVDVNFQDNTGWTALMQASENGDRKIVEFLVNHSNAKVNVRDQDNKTAEQYARENGYEDVAICLEKLAAAENG